MKGLIEYFLYFLISLIILVLFLPVISGTADTLVTRSLETNSRIIASDFADAINFIKQEKFMTTKVDLPNTECSVNITENEVNASVVSAGLSKSYSVYVIQGGPEVVETSLSCNPDEKKQVKIKRDGNEILIEEI